MKQRILIFFLVNLGCFLTACAPLFSDMQGARLLGKKEFEITPGYSSVGIVDEDYNEGVNNFLGVQAGYGLSDKVELRFRFEHSWLKKSFSEEEADTKDNSFNVIAFGPKISLLKDRAALYLPIGLAASNLLEFQPTFLFTIPVIENKIDLNPSVKHIMNLCDGCWQPLAAFNVGLAVSSDISKWAIRPEYGVLYNLSAPGHFQNFSIGLSLNMSTLSKGK
jgi:hypothetical protein